MLPVIPAVAAVNKKGWSKGHFDGDTWIVVEVCQPYLSIALQEFVCKIE